MKQKEIEKCVCCDKGLAHDKNVCFFILNSKYMILNIPAIERQHGLEMMLAGSAAIAHALGPDEDMAKTIDEFQVMVCLDCGTRETMFAIMEAYNQKRRPDRAIGPNRSTSC